MTRFYSIRLWPDGPWRIGPDSGDRDRVDRVFHSDSLYSAVTLAMGQLGELENWLDATARAAEPAVRFSSCFPFHADVDYVVPPRHLWPPSSSGKVRFKGAKFVPMRVVQTLIHGQTIGEDNWTVDADSGCLISAGAQGPFRISVRSSAAVDRAGDGVAPHSTACLEFRPNSGLWMVVRYFDDAARDRWEPLLKSAFRLLQDSGFGGERSRGWGRASSLVYEGLVGFDWDLPAGSETGYWMLSLFHPSSDDAIDWQSGNYSLTTRGGRIESYGHAKYGHAKKDTRMVTEGSVLVASVEPRGSVSDVAPENFPHPVYRSGFAVAIPVPLRPQARVEQEQPSRDREGAVLP